MSKSLQIDFLPNIKNHKVYSSNQTIIMKKVSNKRKEKASRKISPINTHNLTINNAKKANKKRFSTRRLDLLKMSTNQNRMIRTWNLWILKLLSQPWKIGLKAWIKRKAERYKNSIVSTNKWNSMSRNIRSKRRRYKNGSSTKLTKSYLSKRISGEDITKRKEF